MFTNMYQIEQDGRMQQQALLEAQYAQDLAKAALASYPEATHQPPMPQHSRRSFVWPVLSLSGRAIWFSWLVVLMGLVVFALSVEPAAAADHAGNATGGRSGVVSDGRALDGYRLVVDPASDTSLFAVNDAGHARSITAVNDPADAAGVNAVVDSGGTSVDHASMTFTPARSHAGTVSMAIILIVLVAALVMVQASRRSSHRV